jgi:hypothetical protein
LKKGIAERAQCEQKYPDVRFHCVDFRHTLYVEYMTIVDNWWTNEGGKNIRDINHLLSIIYGYANHLVNKKSSSLPYITEFQNDREMQRLSFVYDMIVYREKRYQGRSPLPFALTLSDFIGDLYYLICSYNLSTVHPSPIHSFYPRHLKLNLLPYYIYRLMHEYRHIPELVNSRDIQSRFDTAIKDRLDTIRNSSSTIQIEIDTARDAEYLNIIACVNLSWFMDMYVCFRSLKSYMSHIVMVIGVDHIQQMKQFMKELGIHFISSSLFTNPGLGLVHGAQCISIPVDILPKPRLVFDNNVFTTIIPEFPAYYGKQKRKRNKRTKKKFFNQFI